MTFRAAVTTLATLLCFCARAPAPAQDAAPRTKTVSGIVAAVNANHIWIQGYVPNSGSGTQGSMTHRGMGVIWGDSLKGQFGAEVIKSRICFGNRNVTVLVTAEGDWITRRMRDAPVHAVPISEAMKRGEIPVPHHETTAYLPKDLIPGDVVSLEVVDRAGGECVVIHFGERPGGHVPASRVLPQVHKIPWHIRKQMELDSHRTGGPPPRHVARVYEIFREAEMRRKGTTNRTVLNVAGQFVLDLFWDWLYRYLEREAAKP